MLQCLLKELQNFSISFEFVKEADAKTILELTNEKIEEKIGSFIIDFLIKQQGEGGVILSPIVSTHQKSGRGPAMGKQITEDATGVWAWVYNNRKTLWLEGVSSLDKTKGCANKIDGDIIEERYLEFYKKTDGILVIPLSFKDNLLGIYSIEFPQYATISRAVVEEIIELSNSIAAILWKIEVQKQFNEDISNAISHFRTAIKEETQEKILDEYRTGFFARPFLTEFEPIEKHIKSKRNLNPI